MGDPFRDSETTALARVEDLEAENQRLIEELEVARNLAGSNHQAYVKHLEDQVRDLKKEVAHLTERENWPTTRSQTPMVAPTPESIQAERRSAIMMFGGMGILAALIATLVQLCK